MATDFDDEPERVPKASVLKVESEHQNSSEHTQPTKESSGNDERDETEDDDEGEEDDDAEDDEEIDGQEDEPKLKYHRLTGNLSEVYRNGDATSSFLVAGDKMIIGTHNGNINVLSMPHFHPLRTYHAHSASITSVSVSPFPSPVSHTRPDPATRSQVITETSTSSPARAALDPKSASSPRTPRQIPVPATPSNQIYIATSSIDGHVCVASLVDSKDVMLRNFARPVQSVALSPDFKSDRSYLSGGLAGSLILTTGGRSGVSANANTSSAAAAASGWLTTIGIGTNTGRDTVLHSGEGAISTIKWSLSGKFVVWVNEHGIKIMRSNIKLDGADTDYAWKRIAHIDRPNRSKWEEMAGVWKARAEWIDDSNLETYDDEYLASNGKHNRTPSTGVAASLRNPKNGRPKKQKTEKLVVGWGDTAWVLQVKPEGPGSGTDSGRRVGGSATIVHHLLFDDCIISGLSLYTPSLLLVLAYRTRDDDDNPVPMTVETSPRRGVHHRQTGLTPELRLINVVTKEEVDVDKLTMSRYESLSAADYQLGTLYVPPAPIAVPAPRGTFEALGGGLWDVSINATRIFSSAVSVKSGSGSGENVLAPSSQASTSIGRALPPGRSNQDVFPGASTPGLKSFIISPYDCVLAVKRDLSDHLSWLLDHDKFKDAWELVNEYPEVINSIAVESTLEESQGTPTNRGQSLVDFFADDAASQTTISAPKIRDATAENERRRIGELWIQQLVTAKDWPTAGQVAGRVLGTSPRWEHWVWTFAQAGRFDEITPYIPSKRVHPPLPSLVYEVVLGHYIMRDRQRFKELIDIWDPELFSIDSVISAIESKLASDDVREDTLEGGVQGRDWRILLEALAKLKVADGRPKEALKCYIRLQNADAAMKLIAEYRLVDAVADDIPGLLTLRVPKKQLDKVPLAELEEASAEGIRLLVDEAYHGTVLPQTVVEQLEQQDSAFHPFTYLYLKALWKGQGTETQSHRIRERLESEGRVLVEDFGNLAVKLFAEHDRALLMEFLRASRSYSYEKAATICETKHYYPELVYLLSQTGQTKRALSLIINSLNDVSLAIEFAKEQDDAELWDDLLEYSMDKPRFIRGLLEEVGTSIDPIKLVKRIPEGLEIEGLREGIGRMVREYEIQGSISEGVSRVLKGEVAAGMAQLRSGRAKGIAFEVVPEKKDEAAAETQLVNGQGPRQDDDAVATDEVEKDAEAGHCVGCRNVFLESEKDTLIGFACGHVYHLSCLLSSIDDPTVAAAAGRLKLQLASDADDHDDSRSVGAKVAHAHIIKNVVREGCSKCKTVGD